MWTDLNPGETELQLTVHITNKQSVYFLLLFKKKNPQNMLSI